MSTRQLNSTDLFMREYIMWGGPIVTRLDALRDAQRMALPAGAIDAAVFGAKAVEAPEDPEWHRDFLARIRAQEAGGQTWSCPRHGTKGSWRVRQPCVRLPPDHDGGDGS